MLTMIARLEPGSKVPVKLLRDERETEVTVVVGRRPRPTRNSRVE